MNVLDVLQPDCVKVPLTATDKRAAIDELVDVLASAGAVGDSAELKAAVWQRETQRSTGIGEGLAIPLGKGPAVRRLAMAIGMPAQPIDYDSIDRKPVRLIVMLVSPPDKVTEHVQALGRLSRLMTDAAFRERTYGARSGAELYELFRKAERAD
jgi:fructose-specific phosphotransferase system IIA component